jgi:hypothetical protein
MTTENNVRHLNAIDFMMMDVHRELDEEDIGHPQTNVDKSAGPQSEGHGDEEGVGVSHAQDRPFDPLPPNVVELDVATSHKLQVNRVLQAAYDQKLDRVAIIGWHDDAEVWFYSSDPSIANSLYAMELAKMKLLTAVEDRWNVNIPETRNEPPEPA